MRPLADVGAYYAVSLAVVTAYSVAASGSSYVLLPHFAQGGTIKIKRNMLLLLLIGLLIAVFYIIIGPQLIHWLFKGKYDNFIFLIPYFVIIGILQLLYLLPSTFIGGRATARMLQEFLYFGIISLAINVTLCIILIPKYGLQGAALSTLTAWIFRLASAFFFTHKILQNKKTHLFETITSRE
jgi:O-antigen/teichoic acid export membrane protein